MNICPSKASSTFPRKLDYIPLSLISRILSVIEVSREICYIKIYQLHYPLANIKVRYGLNNRKENDIQVIITP